VHGGQPQQYCSTAGSLSPPAIACSAKPDWMDTGALHRIIVRGIGRKTTFRNDDGRDDLLKLCY
jgi:hypothetical protein